MINKIVLLSIMDVPMGRKRFRVQIIFHTVTFRSNFPGMSSTVHREFFASKYFGG